MWNLKYDTNELTYKTETDSQTESRLVVTKAGVVGQGGGRGSVGLAGANHSIQNG